MCILRKLGKQRCIFANTDVNNQTAPKQQLVTSCTTREQAKHKPKQKSSRLNKNQEVVVLRGGFPTTSVLKNSLSAAAKSCEAQKKPTCPHNYLNIEAILKPTWNMPHPQLRANSKTNRKQNRRQNTTQKVVAHTTKNTTQRTKNPLKHQPEHKQPNHKKH